MVVSERPHRVHHAVPQLPRFVQVREEEVGDLRSQPERHQLRER